MRVSRKHAVGRVLAAAVIIIVVGLSGLGYILYQQTSIKPSTVSLGLDFTPNAGDAPLFYGVAEGIYKANNVNLTIIPGTSVGATVAALEAGKFDFALVSPSSVVDYVANNNVTDIQMVAMEYARSGLVVVFNNASITKISDLDGKSGSMVSPAQGDILGDFKIFAQANNLNVSSMNLQFNPVSTSDQLFLSGKVQFIVVAVNNLGTLRPPAAAAGITLGYFVLADNGLPAAGIAIATTRSMIQQNPNTVRNFVKATMQSLVQAYKNQAAAVADLVKANPQLNQSATLQGYQTLLQTTSIDPTGLSSPLQYGWIDASYMQQTVNTEIVADNLKLTLDATTIYTNQFVQQP